MKIAVHFSERVMYQWPLSYWIEFVRKLTELGHEVYALSDEPNVRIDSRNPALHDRTQLSDEDSRQVLRECDVFIGAALKYHDMAVAEGIRAIALQGSSFKGEGARSTAQCAGCLDKMQGKTDCQYGDELCWNELTPNDVLAAL